MSTLNMVPNLGQHWVTLSVQGVTVTQAGVYSLVGSPTSILGGIKETSGNRNFESQSIRAATATQLNTVNLATGMTYELTEVLQNTNMAVGQLGSVIRGLVEGEVSAGPPTPNGYLQVTFKASSVSGAKTMTLIGLVTDGVEDHQSGESTYRCTLSPVDLGTTANPAEA